MSFLSMQKEEMGEVLHEVDFNQLKIENQQYIEKIDERNQDLLRLKLMAGNTLQLLNSYKVQLTFDIKGLWQKMWIFQRKLIIRKKKASDHNFIRILIAEEIKCIDTILYQFLLQKKLQVLTLESERLKSEISSRQELLSRIDAETNLVEEVSNMLLILL